MTVVATCPMSNSSKLFQCTMRLSKFKITYQSIIMHTDTLKQTHTIKLVYVAQEQDFGLRWKK